MSVADSICLFDLCFITILISSMHRKEPEVTVKKEIKEKVVKEEITKTEVKELKEKPVEKEEVKEISSKTVEERRESLSGKKPPSKTMRRSRGSPPEFIIKPRSRSVFEGSNVRFTCTVNGDPEPTMEWFFEGEPFFSDQRRELKHRNGIATLAIADACAEDIGEYAVVAKNELGEIEHTATLKIDGITKPERKTKEKVKIPIQR